jgi:arginine-tRNA-protein transferase
MSEDSIRLYRTHLHACGYFRDRQASNHVLDPESPRLASVYSQALAQGFRRAGDVLYRTACPGCSACVPYRIPVWQFVPKRSQKRVLARNADVQISWRQAALSDEHLALYQRYLGQRHRGGGMDGAGAEDFSRFLLSAWASTWFMELRLADQLIGCAVTDLCSDGASAVYTYFDPDLSARSLGTLAILKQIEHCRINALSHLYLGFWIQGHAKMDYKRQFAPGQQYLGQHWQPID